MHDQVRRLYEAAGSPSLTQLEHHARLAGFEISRGALWDLLNRKRRPRWSTVEAFVAACSGYARSQRPPIPLPTETIDRQAWRERHAAFHTSGLRDDRIGPAPAAVPRQLPRTVGQLAGRRAELNDMNNLLEDSSSGHAGATSPILLITGSAGVGKTSLAVWWARRVSAKFPDGQLYVNLRGFAHDASPLPPDMALRGFCGAFNVPAHRIPAEVSARSALYRSLLADRRVIVVLDNARDAEQVRPLLPASAGSLAIVTSRIDLTSLVALEGAQCQPLDLLSEDEAREMLRDRLGDTRVAADPRAVDQIIVSCARLPLALAIVAARAITTPQPALASVANELRTAAGGLDALTVDGDANADVRSVLSWSYRALDADAARLFRLLGLHPGPEIDTLAAASLADMTVGHVRTELAELSRSNLISERSAGRYDLHDVLRTYAAELAAIDGEDENREAVRRVVEHYISLARAADQILDPTRDERIRLVEHGPSAQSLRDATHAWSWFRAEHRVLVGTVGLALHHRLERHAWQLAWTLTTFLDRDGHWDDWSATMVAAVEAAERLGHLHGQAIAHRILGHVRSQQDRPDEAIVHLEQALRLFRELGDTASEAGAHNSIGGIRDQQGRHRDALDNSLQALHLYESVGDAVGRAHAFNSVGWCQAQLGLHELALASCEQSRRLHEALNNKYGQAIAWDSIGFVHHVMGDHAKAVVAYEHALDLFRVDEDRFYESITLVHLGDGHHDLGQVTLAQRAWEEALVMLEDIGHSEADSVRQKLFDLNRSEGQ